MMKLTRRELLETAAVGLSLSALTACSREQSAPVPQPAAATETGTLLMFRGLTVLAVSDASVNPPRAAVALITPKDIVLTMNGMKHTLPEHSSILKIPIGASLDTTTATRIKQDAEHDYYSLDNMNVSFAIKDSKDTGVAALSQPALQISQSSRTAEHPCAMPNANDWNSVDWLLDIRTELVPAAFAKTADLRSDWRDSPQVQAMVDLPFGSLEEPTLNNATKAVGEFDQRQWEITVSTAAQKPVRGFKEGARHLFDAGNFLHITLTDRKSTRPPYVIVMDNTPRRIIEVEQLPAVAGDHESTSMEDLVACLGLLDNDVLSKCLDGSCLPVYKGKRACGGLARGCNCCGGTRIRSSKV